MTEIWKQMNSLGKKNFEGSEKISPKLSANYIAPAMEA